MMYIVAVALLGQVQERDVAAERGRVGDLVFASIQVDMVREWTSPKEWSLVLPEGDVRALRAMSCGHYECRELATSVLRQRGAGGLQTILWGRHAKDPEVAERCRRLFTELISCPHCKACDPNVCKPTYRYVNPERCCYCDGAGTLLFTRIYVGKVDYTPDMRVWGYKSAY